MAWDDPKQKKQQQQQHQGDTFQQTGGFEQPQEETQQDPNADFLTAYNQSIVSVSVGEDNTLTVFEAFKEEVERLQVTGIDVLLANSESCGNVNLSSIVLTHTKNIGGKPYCGYYVMGVRSSMEFETQTGNVYGITINRKENPSDHLRDETYNRLVRKMVSERVSGEIHNCSFGVIGDGVVDAAGKVVRNMIKKYLSTGLTAIANVLNQVTGHQLSRPLNLAHIPNSSELRIGTRFNETTTDSVGNPVRADITVVTSVGERNQNQNGQMRATEVTKRRADICKVTGFIDFNINGDALSQGMSQVFDPRFVVTSIGNDKGGTNMELQILGLASTSALAGGQWRPNFLKAQRHTINRVDVKDPAGLAYMWSAQRNSASDSKPELNRHGDEARDLAMFFDFMLQKHMITTQDIVLGGPDYWVQRNFLYAASGEIEYQNMILDAADRLFNGKLKEAVNSRQPTEPSIFPICQMDPNQLHAGFFTDDNGIDRDLRYVDMLFLLNMSEGKNMSQVTDFVQTFTGQYAGSAEVALSKRWDVISTVCPNLTITDLIFRINWNPHFINLISNLASKTAHNIRVDGNPITSAGMDTCMGQSLSQFANSNQSMMQSTNTWGGGTTQSNAVF